MIIATRFEYAAPKNRNHRQIITAFAFSIAERKYRADIRDWVVVTFSDLTGSDALWTVTYTARNKSGDLIEQGYLTLTTAEIRQWFAFAPKGLVKFT
jgi:hypothetical protein